MDIPSIKFPFALQVIALSKDIEFPDDILAKAFLIVRDTLNEDFNYPTPSPGMPMGGAGAFQQMPETLPNAEKLPDWLENEDIEGL